MKSRMLVIVVLSCAFLLALGTYALVHAQSEGGKPYAEGQAPGATLQATGEDQPSGPRAAEGHDPQATLKSGKFDTAQFDQLSQNPRLLGGGGGYPLLYQFSGVRDDGAKGSSGTAATSLLCSNPGATDATLSYYVFNWNSATYYSVSVPVASGHTYTISTQPTALYAEDAYLTATPGGFGTDSINQGMGLVYSDSTSLICTAQVLDPTGNPPAFVAELELFR